MDIMELVPLIAQCTLVLLVASIGLQAQWRDVVSSLRNGGLVLRGVLAVNIIVPIAAILACSLLPIEQPIRIGIVVMAVSPLAPIIGVRIMKAGLDASRVVGLYVALALAAVILVPATIALLSRLFPVDAAISAGAVARLVLMSVLAPLAAGVIVATVAPGVAPRLAKLFTIVGYLVLAVLVVPILVSQGRHIAALAGNGSVLAIAVAAAAGSLAGHLFGGPDPTDRTALALAATMRNPGIAALIVHNNFPDPRVMLAVILYLLTSLIVSFAYQALSKRRAADTEPPPAS